MYQDFLSTVSHAIYMRTDQPPFNDVRVRRAISHAIDRQAIIDAVFIRGEPTPAVSRGLAEWSPRIDELGAGREILSARSQGSQAPAGGGWLSQGLQNAAHRDHWSSARALIIDAAQLAQRYLKDVGIEAELKIQEYGAYMATTYAGKFEGLALGPISNAWEPDSVLYGLYAPDQPRNSGHVNDPKITAMLKEQRRTKDLEARKKIIFDIQRYIAEQQYYVYLYCRRHHWLLAAVCEELFSQHHLRLRRSLCGAVAGAVERADETRRVRGGGAMRQYVLKRLLLVVPTLLLVSIIVFSLNHMLPGDVVVLMFEEKAYAKDLEALRAKLGLDRPLYVQYFSWLGHVVQGNLGESLWTKRPVLEEMMRRLPVSL